MQLDLYKLLVFAEQFLFLSSNCPVFKKHLFYCLFYVGVGVSWPIYGGQRITCATRFFPFAMWVLEIGLGFSNLVTNNFTSWVISPTWHSTFYFMDENWGYGYLALLVHSVCSSLRVSALFCLLHLSSQWKSSLSVFGLSALWSIEFPCWVVGFNENYIITQWSICQRGT